MSQTQSKTDPSTSYGSDQILWDLSDLYNDLSDPAIEDTMSTAQLQAKAFQKRYKGQLAQIGFGRPCAQRLIKTMLGQMVRGPLGTLEFWVC